MDLKLAYPKLNPLELSEIESYDRLLTKLLTEDSDEIFPNSDEYHASLLMSKLLDNTNKSFCMVVGSFEGSISNKLNYIESLTKCLDKPEVNGEVLILEEPNKQSLGYKILKASQKVKIYHANDEARKIIQELQKTSDIDKTPHFSYFDDDKFRYEISTNTYSGFGGFNNKEFVKKLSKSFSKAIKVCDVEINP